MLCSFGWMAARWENTFWRAHNSTVTCWYSDEAPYAVFFKALDIFVHSPDEIISNWMEILEQLFTDYLNKISNGEPECWCHD